MEYKSVSSKLSREEVTLLKDFCEKKGIKPSALIRELILKELEVPIPHIVAGRNRISYEYKSRDVFTWSVVLDSGGESEVLRNVSPRFLKDLQGIINRSIDERKAFIGKKKKDSVPVPSNILRG